MHPGASAALLFLLILLAGCSGGQDDSAPVTSTGPTPTASTAPTGPLPPPQPLVVDLLPDFSFEGCRGLTVRSAQPLDQVQALLPDGFTAAPGPLATDVTGVVGMDLYVCGNLTTPNVRIADIAFGMLYTHVLRPGDRLAGAPEASVHEYAFRLLSGKDTLAALWPAAGYDAYNGSVGLRIGPLGTGFPVDVAARSGNASVGDAYFMLASSMASTLAPEGGTFARYTALGDGSVLVWTGTYQASARDGQGSFQVPDDDSFAGFERANNLAGQASLMEDATIVDQGLRRFF